MTIFQMLALAGAVVAVPVIVYLAMAQKLSENAILAASLSAGFGAFTAVTLWSEGIVPLVANHTVNLWGVQVWYDLLISVTVALFFIVPRARKVGMSIPFWVILVGSTASIALLAMTARLFWLEHALAEDAADAG